MSKTQSLRLTENRFTTLRQAVEELIKAEVASSWSGGGDPADIPVIELELIKARMTYEAALRGVVK